MSCQPPAAFAAPGGYPPTRRGDDVSDPYRWLEDAESPEVAAWIAAQNALTERTLAAVPGREEIRSRLTSSWDFPRSGLPFERGGRWFETRNAGLQDQPVVFVVDPPGGGQTDQGRPLLDANQLSADGSVAVSAIAPNEDGTKLAYATSVAGSDWRTWHVRDVASGLDLDDVVEWSKFSNAAWRHDGSGFYYSSARPPEPGGEHLELSRPDRVVFHRLGTAQDDDTVALSTEDHPDWLADAELSSDGRYLVVTIRRGLDPETRVEILDLERPDSGFRLLVGDFVAEAAVVGNVATTFYVVTDHHAPRRRIVAIDLPPGEADRAGGLDGARQVVGQGEDSLVGASLLGGRLVCHYLRHAHSRVRVHALDGVRLRDLPLPGLVSLAAGPLDNDLISGRVDRSLIYFQTTSFTESGELWSHHLDSGVTWRVRPSRARVDPDKFVTEQVFAVSEDGSRVPMFLTRRRDLSPAGDVPVLLYGYGGFDVAITPWFSVLHMVWMERGGMLAVANLRGGGEYGREWYDAGRREQKQNVFDDLCACARWLTSSGWSRPERLAITGASNGGLLVGACLTQHPELFGAAVAQVGVFDMLRFHRFTIGWAWTTDYGDPDEPVEHAWLRRYSPLHNVRPEGRYPPTLLMTGDHDDRVVPAHSFKFAATLQARHGADAPMLLRVETSAGHGLGKPTTKLIAEATDYLAFLDAAVGPSGA